MEAKPPRAILCPLCSNGLILDGFENIEHDDGTFSAHPSVICSHEPCGANFIIHHSRALFIPKPQPPPAFKKK